MRLRLGASALTVAALTIGGALAGAAPVAAALAVAAPTAPVIRWADCPRDPGYQCGRVNLPLDYDNPTGAKISVAVARFPASDQAHKIGSLFLNPGGPGGSGVDFALGAGQFLDTLLGGKFDIVGFDPRGIARSGPVRCFNSLQDAIDALAPFAFPMTRAEEAVQKTSDHKVSAACVRSAGSIIDHMSTADTARDMDQLRAAVGDSRITYLGFSYGTFLGTVYANLFPSHVRALVVDGVLDPIAWTTGHPGQQALPFSTRLHSDQGAQATLNQFFANCDRAATDSDPATSCAFGPRSARRYAALTRRALAEPIKIRAPDGTVFEVTYADIISGTLGAMYDAGAWPFLDDDLAALEALDPAAPAKQAALARALGLDAARNYPNFVEGFPGVACSDSKNPGAYEAWHDAAISAEARYGYFGRLWTWASSICQSWPGVDADRYLGPFTARTSSPVLVVGNYYDPATRYQGAQTVASLLPNSRLLTYAGYGHTAFVGAGSPCVDAAVTAYLLRGTLPPVGKLCPVAYDPFLEAGAASARTRAPWIVVGLPDAVRRALS